ncbi:MAG: DNA-formamidopyrimidine glycosylase family protein [Actinomycetota bacterium]
MPELPEVQIVARLIGDAVSGSTVESAAALGISTLKTFDPPVGALSASKLLGIRRRGKRLIIDFDSDLHLLIHLMSAGRLQLFDKPGSDRDRTSRFVVRLEGGRQIRLREFGTKQSAWVKILTGEGLADEPSLTSLGPDAWPDPPAFKQLLAVPRPLNNLLRDQHVIAGIGRSWVDEILHRAMLSAFKRGADLTEQEAQRLREATVEVLGFAVEHYTHELSLPIPDKLPMPLQVHRRQGEPCPRCGYTLHAVYFEDYDMCYCPRCQTGGRLLKDRRLSRLLK